MNRRDALKAAVGVAVAPATVAAKPRIKSDRKAIICFSRELWDAEGERICSELRTHGIHVVGSYEDFYRDCLSVRFEGDGLPITCRTAPGAEIRICQLRWNQSGFVRISTGDES